jgi:N-acetylglucosaminyldiphosphoundecaprenol N-acetyl-beta-D-mannosaminyltransferase
VLLGLGQPLQERVAVKIAERHPPAVVLCVGGLFDVLREGPSRPLWARRYGVEWLLRLGEEPTRVWRRYLLGPPETVARILCGKLRVIAPKPTPASAPRAETTPQRSRNPTARVRACR